jgi:hypothetical protein
LIIQHEVQSGKGKQVVTAWLREYGSSESSSTGKEEDSLFLWQVMLPWRAEDAGFERVLAFTASTGGLAQAVRGAHKVKRLS